jgi:hypothetical protein
MAPFANAPARGSPYSRAPERAIHRTQGAPYHDYPREREKRTWKIGLSILLIFQVLVAFGLALFALFDFPGLLGQFGMKHQPDMGILRLIMTTTCSSR